tara:strand:+ start:498 stop:863 length:366 start_codon:yes stop_codon:yes gene_type:complete
MNKGDILEATVKSRIAGYHYIVYYESISANEFAGTFISTDGSFEQNIKMIDNHFEEYDENNELYDIRNDVSFLARAKLIKLESWGPFTKVGQLSNDGVEFLENNIGDLEPVVWVDLIRTQQ